MKLVKRNQTLPVSPADLAKFVLIGRDKLQSVRAEIRAMNTLNLAKGVREQKLREAQDLAGALLDAEARMGEILKAMPKQTAGRPSQISCSAATNLSKSAIVKELGFEKTQAYRFEVLAEHLDLIEAVKAEAAESDKLPTRESVLSKANLQSRKEREVESTKAATRKASPIIREIDCLEALRTVPDIDLLITDPPYFTDGDFTKHVSAYLSKVRTTGQAYVFASADPAEVLAYLQMNRQGMELAQILVWNYNNTGQRQPKVRYNSNYQLVFYFRGRAADDLNRPPDGTHQYACQTVNAPDGRIGDRFHEWQKPISLIERYILNSSSPGEYVFDPFAGTGTVLLAAAKLGRVGCGCEVDAATVKIAVERGCHREV
jgi:hypothetical protein